MVTPNLTGADPMILLALCAGTTIGVFGTLTAVAAFVWVTKRLGFWKAVEP